MTGEKARFTSDRRGPSSSSWTDDGDWAAGVAEGVDVVDGGLIGRPLNQHSESPDSEVDYFERDTMSYNRFENPYDITFDWQLQSSIVSPSENLDISSSTAAQGDTEGGAVGAISDKGDGLNYYPQQGDTFIFETYVSDGQDVPAVTFGSDPNTAVVNGAEGGYCATWDIQNGRILLEKGYQNANESTSATLPTGEFLRGRVTWGDPTITFDWIPRSEDPTTATATASVSLDDTTLSSYRGVGIIINNAFGTSGSTSTMFFDNIGKL